MDLGQEIVSDVGDVLSYSAEPEGKTFVTCTVEYALLPEHLADYADQHGKLTSTQKSDEKDVQSLRARHHGVARLLAEGVPESIVAEMSGYDAAYISTLKLSPAMIQLIEFYRAPKTDAAKMVAEKLRVIADMSIEHIRKKLEEKGDDLTISDLTAVAKLGADRSGNGPNSTVTNVQEHRLVADDEMKELMRTTRARERSRIVDVEAVRSVLPQKEQSGESTGSQEPPYEGPGPHPLGDDRALPPPA